MSAWEASRGGQIIAAVLEDRLKVFLWRVGWYCTHVRRRGRWRSQGQQDAYREPATGGVVQRHAAAMAVSPAGNMINIGYARGLFEEAGLEFMADLDGRWHLTDTVDTRLRFDKKEIAGQLQQIFKTSAAIRPDRVRQDYRPEGFWARAMRQVSLCLP